MNRRQLIAGIALFGAALAPVRALAAAAIGGPFRLVDQFGHPVSERDLLGRPSAIFFGYTLCPEVCPTTLVSFGRWLKKLGPAANRLNVVFVSIDPGRDTPRQMRDYLTSFDQRIRGFTGSPAEVDRMAKAYRVYYRKVPLPGGSYAMDHSAAVYLMDAAGRFVEPIGYGETDDMPMASLRRLMGR